MSYVYCRCIKELVFLWHRQSFWPEWRYLYGKSRKIRIFRIWIGRPDLDWISEDLLHVWKAQEVIWVIKDNNCGGPPTFTNKSIMVTIFVLILLPVSILLQSVYTTQEVVFPESEILTNFNEYQLITTV
jgi:hypothetical protein